ncbi:hypothetical protein BSL78_07181 [Apostichopus japonicus]|uniref:Uncharacterized protein n=1 Tax=Stichopus japonicus TaxID=307972 RepID=A0A2G8L6L7_STIJA|nr:hypothetical protein BSL78_07181 [Apostichopus japonicus]
MKSICGKAPIYLRPIQRDLSLEKVDSVCVSNNSFVVNAIFCNYYLISQIFFLFISIYVCVDNSSFVSMSSFAMTTSTAKSFGVNQMPGPSTSSSVISVNSADKYMSDYIDIMEPDDDSYGSDEDLKAVIEESLRDLDDTR